MASNYEFQKKLKQLASFRGHGTELISVYIPGDYQISEVAGKLRDESGQAMNIKSKSTRTNVTGALERILNHLKIFKQPPKNGIAIFCGNVSNDPSKTNIELFSIEPPDPIKVQLYRCDSLFFLEPLQNMGEQKESFGLVIMDGLETTVATLRGTSVIIHKKLHTTAHSKHRMGGQSAKRFERLHEENVELYYKRVGETMNACFVDKEIKGVIIGGPGPAKEDFAKMKPFDYRLKILGIVESGYTDEQGIREVVAKSGDILGQQAIVEQKKLVDRFLKEVVTSGLVTYGIKEVIEAIESKKANLVLVSEEIPFKKATFKCTKCGKEVIKFSKNLEGEVCDCSGKLQARESEDFVDYLIELGRKSEIKVETISAETSEGAQFLNGFGGIAAFLRYR